MIKFADLDSIDLRLLEALQADSRMPNDQLAERAGISGPACYRRIRRLRDNRAIDREIALVKPQTMGWPLAMILLVTLERDRTDIIDRLIQKFSRVPEIVEAWLVTGDHDFVLRTVARDMEQFDEFTRRVLYSDENIRGFKTLVVMRSVKPISPIPMAEENLTRSPVPR
jgi:Lrp/AsnC family transcriptional regulator, leucine-responsive regulatory protein